MSTLAFGQQLSDKQRSLYSQHQKQVASLKSLSLNDLEYANKLNKIYKDIDQLFIDFEAISNDHIPQAKADMALDYFMLEPLVNATNKKFSKEACEEAIYENNLNKDTSKSLFEFIAKTLSAKCK